MKYSNTIEKTVHNKLIRMGKKKYYVFSLMLHYGTEELFLSQLLKLNL